MPDEWQVVGPKGKAKKVAADVPTVTNHTTDFPDFTAGLAWSAQRGNAEAAAHAVPKDLFHLRQQIERRSSDLQHSPFLCSFKKLWAYAHQQHLQQESAEEDSYSEPFHARLAAEFIIYGLGSPSAGKRDVHCQLAFALLLRSQLPALKQTYAFDPVFSEADVSLLQSYQIQVLEENTSGYRVAEGHTLFFMPHCDCFLYNNLLKANWGLQQMHKIAILGNSFRKYAHYWSNFSSREKREPPHEMLAVVASGTAVELHIGEGPYTSAFGDLSLIVFPEWKVTDQQVPLGSSAPQKPTC